MALMVVGFFAGRTMADSSTAAAADGAVEPEAAEAPGEDRLVRRSAPRSRADQLSAAVSVEELLERALVAEDELEYRELLEQISRRLTPSEAREALALADRFDSTERRGRFVVRLLEVLAEASPQEAMERSLGLADGRSRDQAGRLVLRRWLSSDLEAASQWVMEQPAGPGRSLQMQQVVAATSEHDPELAFELSQQMGVAAASMSMGEIFDSWVERDPTEAARQAEALPSGEGRRRAMSAVACGWAEADGDAALRWASTLPEGQERRQLTGEILRTYAVRHPVEALELAGEAEVDPSTRGSIAVIWARRAPREALSHFETLADGPLRQRGLAAVGMELVRSDPFEAARVAGSLEAGHRRRHLFGLVARELAHDDLEIAAAWALEISSSQDRRAAVPAVVSLWARSAPAAAATFVERLPEGDVRAEASRELVWTWTQHAPERAAQWLAINGADPVTYAQVTRSWAQHDVARAGRWVESLSPGRGRDGALGALSLLLSFENPAAAWGYAEQIGDEQIRSQSLERVAHRWRLSDPEGFMAQVESSGLSGPVRARLLGEPAPDDGCRCPAS